MRKRQNWSGPTGDDVENTEYEVGKFLFIFLILFFQFNNCRLHRHGTCDSHGKIAQFRIGRKSRDGIGLGRFFRIFFPDSLLLFRSSKSSVRAETGSIHGGRQCSVWLFADAGDLKNPLFATLISTSGPGRLRRPRVRWLFCWHSPESAFAPVSYFSQSAYFSVGIFPSQHFPHSA